MNNIKHITTLFIMLLCLSACNNDENLAPLGNWTYEAPIILSPSQGSEIILNENTPSKRIELEWDAATSSENYEVRYTVEVDSANSSLVSEPFMTVISDDGGKSPTVSIGYTILDETLSMLGYTADAYANLQFTVVANIVGTTARDTVDLQVKRFETEWMPEQLYLSGTAAENKGEMSKAILMKKLLDTEHLFEVYTYIDSVGDYKFYSQKQTLAHTYGGVGDSIVKNGSALSVTSAGVYKVLVDLEAHTYSLTKINRLGLLGSPFADQWNSDEALTYQGNGLWQGAINFVKDGGFVVRANNDWSLLLKQETGTVNSLVLESFGTEKGIATEDINSTEKGLINVTIDLSGDGYNYTFSSDDVIADPIDAPDALFLLDQDLNVLGEFMKDGDVFSSANYFALQAGIEYHLNSAQDGSGMSYEINSTMGDADVASADKVEGYPLLSEGTGALLVDIDQAYSISIDFSKAAFSWHYYNLKIFHWDDVNAGWDDRDEIPLIYSHPYTFTVTADLYAGFDSKFFSPWDVEYGAQANSDDDATSAKGSMTNKGKDDSEAVNNFKFITTDGSYTVELVISADYTTGSYSVQ